MPTIRPKPPARTESCQYLRHTNNQIWRAPASKPGSMQEPYLTLQGRPPPSRGPQNLADFIRRVNAEPGGFRALDEDDVKRQIEAQKFKPEDDVEMEDNVEADKPDKTDKAKDLMAAREELFRTIDFAHHTAGITLDFVSLLLSKENPVQAVTTLSPELRSMVGIGTLGATNLDAPTTLAQSRVADTKMIAIGKRLIDVNRVADAALEGAKRLQQQVDLETKYWAEVLEVGRAGWQTFRVPSELHSMGVKFGFSNASAEFRANSIAALKRAEDGSVRLEPGKLAEKSMRLQVSILENGALVGRSSLAHPLPDNAPLEDRVKEARNSIFEQELWHELNREGRGLTGHNVRLEKSAVTFIASPTRTVSFQLVDLEDNDNAAPAKSRPEDDKAETINLTLHLLLINAHRQNVAGRYAQQAPKAKRGPPPPYSLLLPIITYYKHEKIVEQCMEFFSAFVGVLRSAGLEASCVMTEAPITQLPEAKPSELLARGLLRPSDIQFDLTITPSSRVRILTKANPTYGTRFLLFLLPPVQAESEYHLAKCFPPADINSIDGLYDSTKQLFWYLTHAVPRALTLQYASTLQYYKNSPGGENRRLHSWIAHFSNKGLVDRDTEGYGVQFEFPINPDTGFPELHAAGDFLEDDQKAHREWTWSVSREQENVDTLSSVVSFILSNGPLPERPGL
ncbi:subunit 17 of mediator complex-domain-containing protein [Podospora didyma]|uniref:Mediator of RNA polymerase II transcription subunit 17 n=1 Tax=Podospora didyma TaxID=330526 RepID=A0AAE0K8C0_9PEZI|nr:subunit 17 of mediator complex-domain-containing protein [Podospora didyma]